MSIDQYRNISFSAYIEYDFLAQANLPKMYLEYSTHFMLFFSPHVAFALEAFVHLYAAAKMYFLAYKVIRNRSILGPCQFLIFITKHLVKFVLSICLETWKNLYGRNLEKVKNLYGNVKDLFKKNEKLYGKCWIRLKKWKNLYGKNMEKWRICMETWRVYKEK